MTKNDFVYEIMNGLLVVHDRNQDKELDFWCVVVLNRKEVKEKIVQEMHSTPYGATLEFRGH